MNGTNEHEDQNDEDNRLSDEAKERFKTGYVTLLVKEENASLREQLAKEIERADVGRNLFINCKEQLLRERALRKELYQATYDWTDHMELWMEERKFRIDSADLDVFKELIQQGQKVIEKAKLLDDKEVK